MTSRHDIEALRRQIAAAELTIRSAQGAYAPSLGVNAGLTEAGKTLDSLVWNWSATAQLSWSLFQGGSRAGK